MDETITVTLLLCLFTGTILGLVFIIKTVMATRADERAFAAATQPTPPAPPSPAAAMTRAIRSTKDPDIRDWLTEQARTAGIDIVRGDGR
jgi:hypothetical protein